jgi:hypothetical protein
VYKNIPKSKRSLENPVSELLVVWTKTGILPVLIWLLINGHEVVLNAGWAERLKPLALH